MLIVVRFPSRTITSFDASLKRSASALPTKKPQNACAWPAHSASSNAMKARFMIQGSPWSPCRVKRRAAGKGLQQVLRTGRSEDSEMAVRAQRGHAPARGALQVTLLYEVRLEHVFD